MFIALRGVQSEKKFFQPTQAIPYVGADSGGEYSQMGVGLELFEDGLPKGYWFWGLVIPHNLIQSWRAMKILERIDSVDKGTLCACWSVARGNLRESDLGYLDKLAVVHGYGFAAIRNEILNFVPSGDQLAAMIAVFRENGVRIDATEFEEEMRTGRMVIDPLIEAVLKDHEEYVQKLHEK